MTVTDWLLDSDPAIRWQVQRDLLGASPEEVAAERSRVATQGWGAHLLSLRRDDGWAGGACFPGDFDWATGFEHGQPWTSTFPTLQLLMELGVDPQAEPVREAIAAVRANVRWEHDQQPFFEGEVEPCINGRTAAVGAYFGEDVSGIVERLVGEQLEDGGWNCEVENGSVRSSFHTTLSVLDGLLAHERATGGTAASVEARRVGEEYLLARHLMRRASSGEVVDPQFLELSFPTWWHYDVLRGLDHLRRAGTADPRIDEAVALVRSKQQPDGRWLLDHTHPGDVNVEMEREGEPSRWITLRATRVLAWADAR